MRRCCPLVLYLRANVFIIYNMKRIIIGIGDSGFSVFDAFARHLGDAFRQLGRDVVEESFEITVRNHKDQDVEVRVLEHLFRWSEWEIVQESADHTKLDQGTVEWRLPVPADGETTLSYTVRYEF